MLIGISASQSQGKTTVLNALEKLGYNVIPNKTSRFILNKWGYTLSEVNAYAPLAVKFQDEILKVHQENNKHALNSNEIFLQERTYADIMSYAICTDVGSNNTYSAWMDGYYDQCKTLQNQYDGIIYLSGRESIQPVADGVRSTNVQYSKLIDLAIKYYIQSFNVNDNVLFVNTSDHEERVQIISDYLSNLIK